MIVEDDQGNTVEQLPPPSLLDQVRELFSRNPDAAGQATRVRRNAITPDERIASIVLIFEDLPEPQKIQLIQQLMATVQGQEGGVILLRNLLERNTVRGSEAIESAHLSSEVLHRWGMILMRRHREGHLQNASCVQKKDLIRAAITFFAELLFLVFALPASEGIFAHVMSGKKLPKPTDPFWSTDYVLILSGIACFAHLIFSALLLRPLLEGRYGRQYHPSTWASMWAVNCKTWLRNIVELFIRYGGGAVIVASRQSPEALLDPNLRLSLLTVGLGGGLVAGQSVRGLLELCARRWPRFESEVARSVTSRASQLLSVLLALFALCAAGLVWMWGALHTSLERVGSPVVRVVGNGLGQGAHQVGAIADGVRRAIEAMRHGIPGANPATQPLLV